MKGDASTMPLKASPTISLEIRCQKGLKRWIGFHQPFEGVVLKEIVPGLLGGPGDLFEPTASLSKECQHFLVIPLRAKCKTVSLGISGGELIQRIVC